MPSPSHRRRARHDCLAVCLPGFEGLVAGELEALQIRAGRRVKGGVVFQATTRQLYAANLWLRTATRVLVRVATFSATSFRSLEQQAADIGWTRWLADDVRPQFRVTSTTSKLYHTDAVAERLLRVCGHSPTGADGDDPDQPVQPFVVRIDHDRLTISVDASGSPLYQRGWRGPQAKAPLRETIAAALLLAVGWDATAPLVDPMCGSGTIAIEAATIGRHMAPASQRELAFGSWPTFEPGTWSSVVADARSAATGDVGVPIVATDRDDGAVDATIANAEQAGVEGDIDAHRASVSDLVDPSDPGASPGWLVTNPPYGKRASDGRDLRNLFARLGDVVRAELPDWGVALLVHDPRLAHHSGLPLTERLAFTNGGLAVHLLVKERGR